MVYGIDFRTILFNLEAMGLLDVILPFFLIFTLVFAVLQKSKILKGESEVLMKRYNVVIALVMALAIVIPHVTRSYPGRSPVDIINSALPQVSVILVAILMFLLLLGIFGAQYNIGDNSAGGIVTILALGSVFTIFGVSAGWFDGRLPYWLDFLRDPQLQSLIIVILVFGLIIKFITYEDDDDDSDDDTLLDKFAEPIDRD